MTSSTPNLSPESLIAFTGGGSAGHVTPNLALIESWQAQGGRAIYIGRSKSIESELLERLDDVPFLSIPSERLRRYFHWGNFIMPFIVLVGIIKAYLHLRKFRPRVLFSKGGFVALPVVIGGWLNRIPVIIHESDGSLGLANRLSLPFTTHVCVAQKRAKKRINHPSVHHTGSPVRLEFEVPSPHKALTQFNLKSALPPSYSGLREMSTPQQKIEDFFQQERPLLVVFGGSQGSHKINEEIRSNLNQLMEQFEVVHVCGKGGVEEEISHEFYHQFEYIHQGFADLLAAASIVIGRAGANAIAELNAVKTPALLVPLSIHNSRGDQLLNAQEYQELGYGLYIENERFNAETLNEYLYQMKAEYFSYLKSINDGLQKQGTASLIQLIKSSFS